jgi:nitrogen fixation protein NifU and related proteins
MYSSELLDYFQNPRNVGEIADADASAQLENPACGDVLKLTLKVSGEQIVDIRFKARGCVPAMACGSALTSLVKGKTLSEARGLQPDDLVKTVGGVPEASTHATQLALETLATALDRVSMTRAEQ